MARDAWGNFGATLAEYPHLCDIAQRGFREHVDLVLCPEVAARCAAGLPSVFVTAHLGNWELAAAAAASTGVPLSAVYARQANPLIDRMVQRRRRALGCGFVTNEAGARPLLAELAAGRSLGMLADLRVDRGEPIPFFGQMVPTTLVPARLALKFGCPLVPMRVERLGGARFRVTAHPPVRPEDASADPLDAGEQHDAPVQRAARGLDPRAARWLAMPQAALEQEPGLAGTGPRGADGGESRRVRPRGWRQQILNGTAANVATADRMADDNPADAISDQASWRGRHGR